jgi:uncharacterized protein YaeQ
MALQATIYTFDIELADNDRGVYESLALRLARHPSESDEYLIARLLAYLREFRDGIAFSRGVSEPDEPAIAVRDSTGAITTWIDIGTPDARRLPTRTPRRFQYVDFGWRAVRLDRDREPRRQRRAVEARTRSIVAAPAPSGSGPICRHDVPFTGRG